MRNKIKARRNAERYKETSTDSEERTPDRFEDSNAIATESPKNKDTLNTTRKHADAQPTKSAGIKTSKRRSIVEMVQKLKKYVPIVVCGDVLYYYNGYYYEAIGLEKLIKLYRKYVDYDLNNEPSLYAYKDLYQCCTTDPELERSEPENQSIHAPLENGVYDLMKKELKPHDPRRLIFTYIKANYDESAECPVFDSFLKQITHGNPQLEERFWMAIGYLMIYPARGKFFIVMGYARDSGKSVLGNFVQRLYPKESVGNLRLQEMKGTFSSMSFLNAVINLELDMPNAKLNAEVASRLKQITGGDSITVQRKYLSPVTLTRRIKFVFAGNYPLCIDGEDDALQKRIVFLPFDESIPDDQQDPYLEDKIWDERDAVVTKSLHYARKLVKLNYKFPEIPQVDDAKCIVRDSIAKTVGKFVQESCDMSEPKAVTATEDLYNAYWDYCKEKDKTFLNERKQFQAVRRFGAQHAYKSDYYNTGAMTIRLGNVIENNGVNSVYDGYILASDGTAYNVRVNAPNGYYQPGNTYDDLNPVLIKLGYTNSLGVYVEENFAYLLAPDCSYADLEELSNLANEAIGAQMKYPNDVNNMYRNTYNAYPLSKVWNFYTRSWS